MEHIRHFPETRASLLCLLRDGQGSATQPAWREFFECYAPAVYRVARRRGLGTSDADDIVQQAMVAIATHIKDFRYEQDRGKFRQWVKTITGNKIHDLFRQRRAMAGSVEIEHHDVQSCTDRGPDVADLWETEWRVQDMLHCLDQVRREIAPWYMPRDPGVGRSGDPVCKVAWRGGNGTFANVGCYVFGMDNPHPERDIAEVVFTAAETDCKWFVLGITACDLAVYFPPSDVSFGIPHNWGAAAVVYALVEGLAGIKDTGRAFDRALLAPRWSAAGVKSAAATAKYEASGGYVRYRYALDEAAGKMSVEAASSADSVRLEILLPAGKEPKGVTLDGKKTEFETKTVESSRYACLDLEGVGVHEIEVAIG